MIFTFIPIFGTYTVPQLVGDIDSYMLGNLIDRFETHSSNGTGSVTYDMSRCANGIYHFVVTGKEGTVTKKVIIQH